MAYKDKNDPRAKASRLRWYYKNKHHQMRKRREARSKRMKWFQEYKRTKECSDCGMSFKNCPECCDSHHVDPKQKESTLSPIVRESTIKKALEELKKCIPLCANCHRKRHFKKYMPIMPCDRVVR